MRVRDALGRCTEVDVLGWMLGMGMAWAAGPIEVPLMVPARPTKQLATQPTGTIGWTVGKAGPARADMKPGRTLVQRPFLRVDDQAVCRCDHWRVSCGLLEDGGVVFDLVPTDVPPKDPNLATCTLEGRTFSVVGVEPALPGPWEDRPDHWNVAMRWGGTDPVEVALLWLRSPAGWTATEGCHIAGDRKHAVLTWTGLASGDDFALCATERGGREVWVRAVPFVLPWTTKSEETPPVSPAP